MIKNLYSIAFIFIVSFSNAQVGVNTDTPAATLDIKEKRSGTVNDAAAADGFISPRLTKSELAAKSATAYDTPQKGAIVFVTDAASPSGNPPSLSEVANIDTPGYYYFDGNVWIGIPSGKIDLRMVGASNHLTMDAGINGNGTSAGTGSFNLGMGYNTLNKITSANAAIAMGYNSLANLTTGDQNLGIGTYTLFSLTTTNGNTALGHESLVQQRANNSTAVGAFALNKAFGDNNTALGANAGAGFLQATDNTIIGANAAQKTPSGDHNHLGNTFIGSGAANDNQAASNVTLQNIVALGANTLQSLSNTSVTSIHSYSTFLGNSSTLASNVTTGVTYATAIGAGSQVGASNSVVLGRVPGFPSASTPQDNIGIGTVAPTNPLTVVGDTTKDPVKIANLKTTEITTGPVTAKKYDTRVLVTKTSDATADPNNIKTAKSVMPKFFYSPPVDIPLYNASGVFLTGIQTINLYANYQSQMNASATSATSVSSEANNGIPILSPDELIYHVTYYDPAVFTNVSISTSGILSYAILSNANVTSKTYMNIVFEVKN